MLPQNGHPMLPWRASLSVLHALSISSTVFRLSQRYASRRLWYDDYAALFAVITDCVYFAVLHVWTRSEPNGTTFGKGTTITFYWIGTACFLFVLWPSKVSLALAIARIFPPGRTIRRFAMGMAWSFGLMGIGLLFGMAISCGRDTSWHDSPEAQCDALNALGTAGLCAGLISDALLIFTPLRMLWRMKLPDEQRRLILAGFAASVWTSVVGGICFALMFGPDSWGLPRRVIPPLLGHAMASVSLIVCNSMVIVTYVYRLVRSDEDLERSVSEAVSNDVSLLTTVILTDPESSDDALSQSPCRRGVSHNGRAFSEQNLASFGPPLLSVKSRAVPRACRSV